MTNLPNLSARARKALDILADGGQFVQRLERDPYTRRDQFQYRLMIGCHVQKGFGLAVFYELKNAGFLRLHSSTSVSTYYRMEEAA